MSDIAISVEGVGKKYSIGQGSGLSGSLRELGTSIIDSALRRKQVREQADSREFWALRDVSFSVPAGKVLGIIGRNGAGKSTLLKLLSEITEPTEGHISINGRVGSLLEVGTGFHPDLSGRENVFLNAAILGMSRREARSKFDEIVEFSGVERFIDTPVKRYSSGMYLRLGFAVAAHLETEILIVDEVLAVGDAEFQRRCLQKMGDVSAGGRTVILVSHNMNVVERLSNRIIWLAAGRILDDSEAINDITERYLELDVPSGEQLSATWADISERAWNPWFVPRRMYIVDSAGMTTAGPFKRTSRAWLTLEFDVQQATRALSVGYALYACDGSCIYQTFDTDKGEESWPRRAAGHITLRTELPLQWLNEGRFTVEVLAKMHGDGTLLEANQDAARIEFVVQGGLSQSPYWTSARPGHIAPEVLWEECR